MHKYVFHYQSPNAKICNLRVRNDAEEKNVQCSLRTAYGIKNGFWHIANKEAGDAIFLL